MSVPVNKENAIVPCDADSVSINQKSIAPRGEKIALPVKDQDGRVLAALDVDPV